MHARTSGHSPLLQSSAGWALLLSFFAFSPPICAQDITRKRLEHEDYDRWQTLTQSSLSNDGQWASYTVQNGAADGEATLHIRHLESTREFVVPRGAGVRFSFDSRYAIYRVTPEKQLVKRLREVKKTDAIPRPTLQILELESGSVRPLADVRSFDLPEKNGEWLACLLEPAASPEELESKKASSRESYVVGPQGLQRPEKPQKLKSREELSRERGETPAGTEAGSTPAESTQNAASTKSSEPEGHTSEPPRSKGDQADREPKAIGTPLTLVHLPTGVQRTYPAVVEFQFSNAGEILAFATSIAAADDEQGDAEESEPTTKTPAAEPVDGVHVLSLKTLDLSTVAHGSGVYKNLAVSEDGSQLAFITNRDDLEAEPPGWALYHWRSRSKAAHKIAAEESAGVPAGWWVAANSNQRFSQDGRRLYFDTAPIPDDVLEQREAQAAGREPSEEDAEDEVKLDIWHWQDPQLQPEQLIQAERERRRNYRAAYVLASKKVVQLATRAIPDVSVDYRSTASQAVANSNVRYRKTLSWDVPGFQDVYLVNLNTGASVRVLEKVRWRASLSPEGKFLIWFDAEAGDWYAKSVRDLDAKPVVMSRGIDHPLFDELDDRPSLPRAYGAAGWLEKDAGFVVYDRFDMWQLDPNGKLPPRCLTDGRGRAAKIRFRYRQLDREQRAIASDHPMLLEAFDRTTKASGFYTLLPASRVDAEAQALQPRIMLDENLSGLQKAQDSEVVLFTRSTFRNCPDLWASTLDFERIDRVSDINPQQDQYSWGTAELVHWQAQDGQTLDGILLKPDGFDPSRKYPMLVYFYERNSDNLHSYYPPAAGRSIICHSFYVSRGYVVFIPDIPYQTGAPGPSAANAILPGVEHLVEQGFIDQRRIGMQGHSWGGYQAAYLVTQTNLFACAEAGAPVSNMTSAYGGIRWQSGMSRMFQYERTQSRIGEDLWAARDKYIANSPLFFADKIETPLLILHNDEDGAVPWYQGIELFVALRRLEKPAWMLNYNGNPHWVMGDANRRDFAIRMQQFFDHYLLDAPEPEWMAVGVPATDKGENDGLELLEPMQPATAEPEAVPEP